MPRYFFDVYNTDDDAWDEDGLECADQAAIEDHVRKVLADHADHHDGGQAPISVSVLDDRSVIVTAVLDEGGNAKFLWTNV